MWLPNGAYVSPLLPYSFMDATITKVGYTMTLQTDDGIKVEYSDNHKVCVTVPCKYRYANIFKAFNLTFTQKYNRKTLL